MADSKTCEELKLDNQLCFALYSTSLAMSKLYKPYLQAMQLTYPQYLIMLILWEQDGVTLSDLGKKVMQDLGALSPVIKRMEIAGLISRQPSQEDERKVIICLTDAGQALQQQAKQIPADILCSTRLSIEGIAELRQQLQMLRQQLTTSTKDE